VVIQSYVSGCWRLWGCRGGVVWVGGGVMLLQQGCGGGGRLRKVADRARELLAE